MAVCRFAQVSAASNIFGTDMSFAVEPFGHDAAGMGEISMPSPRVDFQEHTDDSTFSGSFCEDGLEVAA